MNMPYIIMMVGISSSFRWYSTVPRPSMKNTAICSESCSNRFVQKQRWKTFSAANMHHYLTVRTTHAHSEDWMAFELKFNSISLLVLRTRIKCIVLEYNKAVQLPDQANHNEQCSTLDYYFISLAHMLVTYHIPCYTSGTHWSHWFYEMLNAATFPFPHCNA